MRIGLFTWMLCLASGCDGRIARPPMSGLDGGTVDDAKPDLSAVPFGDFPSSPILDSPDGGAAVPANAPALFNGANDQSAPPCLLEPEPDTLLPRNWLRPRVHFIPQSGQNLFEIKIHAPGEANDLFVYTAQHTWTLPASMWQQLAVHSVDQTITVSVRGAVSNGQALTAGPSAPATADFTIAPVEANGAVVYWTTTAGSSLKGFMVGDEGVVTVLTPSEVKMPTVNGAQVTCLGCHTATPDGAYAGFTAQGPWGNAIASVQPGMAGMEPPFLTQGAIAALGQSEIGIQTFSKAHWSAGDHIEIAPYGDDTGSQLAWFDLEAQSGAKGVGYGFLARTGDSRGVGAPSWSHDGQTIAYVSTTTETTGRLGKGDADLFTVPYNNRMGGMATAVKGASDPNWNEYYPAYSADDALLAFARIPTGSDMYNDPQAEVFVVAAGGGQAARLAANDPPACTGKKSPGITNSWPKWSPEVLSEGTRSFYWLIFSSTRDEMGNPQLYMTGLVVDSSQEIPTIETHGAVYLWNQPSTENNHTPAWDVFQIPVQ